MAAATFAAARGCLSSFCQQLAQPWIPGCHLPQLLQLQEGINVPAALLIHLLPILTLFRPL